MSFSEKMFDKYDFDQPHVCQRPVSTLTRDVDTYTFLEIKCLISMILINVMCQRHVSTLTRDVDTYPFLEIKCLIHMILINIKCVNVMRQR
jgi:hypothetical protein